jgi:hypothetical protein
MQRNQPSFEAMANKPKLTVISTAPVVVHVNKNGRPVQEATAKFHVEKHFPEVKEWKFEKTDHSILATQVH